LLKPILIILLLNIYVFSVIEAYPTYEQKSEKSSKITLSEGNAAAFPCGIKEEASGPSAAIKLPAFLKAILPPPSLAVKLNGESHYDNTRSRLAPVVWNPTIPIALKKLTI